GSPDASGACGDRDDHGIQQLQPPGHHPELQLRPPRSCGRPRRQPLVHRRGREPASRGRRCGTAEADRQVSPRRRIAVVQSPHGNHAINLTPFEHPGSPTAAQPVTTTVTQNPQAITTGPDGNLWFTIQQSRTIGVMNTGGSLVHDYPTNNLPGLAGITAGPEKAPGPTYLYVTAEGDATPNPAHPMRPSMTGNG